MFVYATFGGVSSKSDECYAKSQEKKFKEERKKQKKKILSIDDVLKIGRKHNIVGYANIAKFIEENGITQ